MLNKKSILVSILLVTQVSAQTVGTEKDNIAHDNITNPIAEKLKSDDEVHCKVFRLNQKKERVYYDLSGVIVRRSGSTIIVSGIEPRLRRPALIKVDTKACVTSDYKITKDFEIVEIPLSQRKIKLSKVRLKEALDEAVSEINHEVAEVPVEVDLRSTTQEDDKKKRPKRSFESLIDEGVSRFNEVSSHDTDRLKKKIKKNVETQAIEPEIVETEPQVEDVVAEDVKIELKEAPEKKEAPVEKKTAEAPKQVAQEKSPEKSSSLLGSLKHFFFGKE